jgi:hypothetical protein
VSDLLVAYLRSQTDSEAIKVSEKSTVKIMQITEITDDQASILHWQPVLVSISMAEHYFWQVFEGESGRECSERRENRVFRF